MVETERERERERERGVAKDKREQEKRCKQDLRNATHLILAYSKKPVQPSNIKLDCRCIPRTNALAYFGQIVQKSFIIPAVGRRLSFRLSTWWTTSRTLNASAPSTTATPTWAQCYKTFYCRNLPVLVMIECLTPSSLSSLVKCMWVRPRASPIGCSSDWLWSYSQTLGWKGLPRTNTLAYCENS